MTDPRLRSIWLPLLLLLGSGCATLIKGTHADVQILTEPPGAEISVDGQPVGHSPLTANLHQGNHAVEAHLDGYKKGEGDIKASFSGHSLWLASFSVLTDALLDTILTIDDDVITLRLEPDVAIAGTVVPPVEAAPPVGPPQPAEAVGAVGALSPATTPPGPPPAAARAGRRCEGALLVGGALDAASLAPLRGATRAWLESQGLSVLDQGKAEAALAFGKVSRADELDATSAEDVRARLEAPWLVVVQLRPGDGGRLHVRLLRIVRGDAQSGYAWAEKRALVGNPAAAVARFGSELTPPGCAGGSFEATTSATTLGTDGLHRVTSEESADRKASSVLDVGGQGGGLGLAYSEQSLERRGGPVDAVRVTTWTVSYSGVVGGMASSNGGGGGIGIRYLDPSGDFPDERGGSVHALDARGSVNLFANSAGDSTFVMGQLAASVAYTYLDLSPQKFEELALKPEDRKNSGIGFNLGLGLTASVPFADGAEASFAPVPLLGFELPTYNPGTASYSSFNILGFVLPPGILGDFTLLAVSLGGSFE